MFGLSIFSSLTSTFCFFQSISGLYLSNQERPKITGFDGDLMTLKTTVVRCWSIKISKALVSWVTSPDTRDLLSITSTDTGNFFVTKGSL